MSFNGGKFFRSLLAIPVAAALGGPPASARSTDELATPRNPTASLDQQSRQWREREAIERYVKEMDAAFNALRSSVATVLNNEETEERGELPKDAFPKDTQHLASKLRDITARQWRAQAIMLRLQNATIIAVNPADISDYYAQLAELSEQQNEDIFYATNMLDFYFSDPEIRILFSTFIHQ